MQPFSIDSEVTLSTVYRAKGNEAAIVFVVGVEALYSSRKLRRARNKLFTACTRAKSWLRVSGIGAGAKFFCEELRTALEQSPRLEFTYPDIEVVDRIQHDLSDKVGQLKKLQERLEQEEHEILVAQLGKRRRK